MAKSRIVIGFHEADAPMKERLFQHLGPMAREHGIHIWDAGQTLAGSNKRQEHQNAIRDAAIIILLVSIDLLNSQSFLLDELPEMLRRQAHENLHLFPIIVRPCDWQAIDWLRGLQVRPHGRGITNLDSDFADVAAEVRVVLGSRTLQFFDFFGRTVRTSAPTLVFSKRTLGDTSLFEYPDYKRLGKGFPTARDGARPKEQPLLLPAPEDVEAWLAYEDIRAAGYLGKLFGDYSNQFVDFRIDARLDDSDWRLQPTISIGLGFTSHTHRILEKTSLGKVLSIDWRLMEGQEKRFVTDVFRFRRRVPVLDEGTDIALIARVAAPADGHVHFICAGRTAPGTAVAGHFLAADLEATIGPVRFPRKGPPQASPGGPHSASQADPG